MITFPNAKINLGLNIVSRRTDGFHNISTVMVPVALHDILEIIPGAEREDELALSGHPLDAQGQETLCLTACRLFRQEFGGGYVKMHLHKVIPPGTGLGGGSSDASHTLLMMNEIYAGGATLDDLHELSSRLGSDCPFFIRNQPALATGRGEVLNKVPLTLEGKDLVILLPNLHVSTAWAYSRIVPCRHKVPPRQGIKRDISAWRELLVNDFEKPVFEHFPALRELKLKLYRSGALYASMSGSGSALFGIFDAIPGNIQQDFSGIKLVRTSFA